MKPESQNPQSREKKTLAPKSTEFSLLPFPSPPTGGAQWYDLRRTASLFPPASMERMPDNRRPKLSDAAGVPAGGGEDRLSALPDDLLIHILLKQSSSGTPPSPLGPASSPAAGAASGLSCRSSTSPPALTPTVFAPPSPPMMRRPSAASSLTPSRVKCSNRFLMEEMTKFPKVTSLTLAVMAFEHSFGASLFHVLRISSGIRELEVKLALPSKPKPYPPCQSGCICAEPSNWETEELVLPCLKEVVINDLRGTEHELALVKRLFNWTKMLEGMRVNFHDSITESKGEELRKLLLSFSRPGLRMNFTHHGEVCSYD
ncbi:uncharacterized protein LOC119341287 isoform X2 [Triticum dicoccoides]|uniref:uncharacterized protein LOC119341287 isoform X2 n=1 Tax=Triticum dicoccoides TaxID=85692 RepID=UPI0018914131|nr:uncharacterized protein LOC119341287 isoform X2 [Triticum dicoccoides]